jgi:soluble calcium-activated nucleotidase 1
VDNTARFINDGSLCLGLSFSPFFYNISYIFVNFSRASKETYDETADESRGTNLLLTADDTFSQIEVHHVGEKGSGSRGFSAFQFVPNTGDDLIVALKSEERDGRPVASYLTVFRFSDGHILLNEAKLKGAHKFEGIEFAP